MKLKNRLVQASKNSPVYDCGLQSERHERPMGRVVPVASVSKPRFLKPGTNVTATSYGRTARINVGTIVSTVDRYRFGV